LPWRWIADHPCDRLDRLSLAHRRFEVPSRRVSRAAMDTVAFILLMIGELSISLLLAGRRLDEHLQLYREASQMLGLTGQFAFALFPALQIWIASPPSARGKEIQ
jgi:hypothetical protein